MVRFPPAVDFLEQGLAASSARHATLANNVANVNTPGFKRSYVEFETLLQDALSAGAGNGLAGRTTDPRHIPIGTGSHGAVPRIAPIVREAQDREARMDGNNVNMEVEMANLATNQLWYGALTRQISDQFARLRLAIDGRR